jgi:hypothetical protein
VYLVLVGRITGSFVAFAEFAGVHPSSVAVGLPSGRGHFLATAAAASVGMAELEAFLERVAVPADAVGVE